MGIKVAELLVEVGADVTRATRDLQQFSHQVGSGGLLGSLGKAGVAAFAGIGAAAGGMVGVGLKVAGDMEQAKIGFESMLGSAEKADVFLKELKDFAVNTPFEMDSVVEGARRLLAMGTTAEQVRPLLTSIGDAVAAMGGGSEMIDRVTTALGQMQAKGKVSAEEMLQLAEAGIPAWDMLAAKLGTDVPTAMDMVSQGAVDAQTFIAAFMEGTAQRFGGAMDKQSQSLLGMFSALKDGITNKLGEALGGPVAEKLKDLFPKVQEQLMAGLDKILPAFADAAVGLISALAPIVDAIAPIVQMIGDIFAEIGPVIGDVIGQLAPHVADLAVIFAELAKALSPLIPAAGRILEAVAPVAVEFAKIAVTVADALVPVIVKLVDLLAPFIDDIVRLGAPLLAAYKGFKLITGAMQAFRAISFSMTLSNPMLLVLAAIAAAAVLIITNWDKVWPVIKKVGQWFADVFGKIWDVLGPILEKVVEFGKKIILGIWDGMKWVWDKFWWWNVELPLKILDALWQGLQKLWDLGKAAFSWLWDGIRWVWDQLWHWLVERPAQVLQMLFDGFGRLWDAGMHLIQSIWNGIVAAWDWFIGQVARIGGWIWDTIWGSLKNIWQIGVDLLHGLWDGIVSVKDWIIDKIKGLGRSIINGFKSIFGISSPSTVFARQGMHMMEGLAAGISGGAQLPADALARVSRGLTADASMTFTAGGIPGSAGLGGGSGAVAGAAPQITVIVQGSIVDRDGLARAVDDAVARLGRRTSTLQMSGVI